MKKIKTICCFLYEEASKQKLKSLRLTLILFLMVGVHQSYAQNILETKVSVKIENATLVQVIKELQKQVDFQFLFNKKEVKDVVNINLNLENATIKTVLTEALKNYELGFEVVDGAIVITPAPKTKSSQKKLTNESLLSITGLVKDEDGEPLLGATVLIKGTMKGTTTDANGRYAIKVPKGTVLIFSFVGFLKQEIVTPAEDTEINVSMKEAAMELEEVAVISTGYQKIKPEQSTGSIATMRAKEYDSRINTMDFLTSLENRIPGLLINNDIEFDENSLFQIRGISTINGSTDPLIVIDGFPTELSLDMINPNEIESVTVLKDAAAATVYGVRASNGVIVIERKKAKVGDIKVNFRATMGFKPKENYDRYRWDEDASNIYINYQRESYSGSSYMWNLILNPSSSANYDVDELSLIQIKESAGVITAEEAEELYAELGSYNNTDDYSRLFERTAVTQTYNLNLSGGNEKLLYSLTANYIDNKTSEIKNNNSRFSLSGRATMKFSDRFSLDLTTDFQESKLSSVSIPDFNSLYLYERFEDEDGNPLPVAYKSYANSYYNDYLISIGLYDNMYYPLVDMDEVSTETHTVNNHITANFRYDIGKGFNLSFGGVYETSRTDIRYLATENSSVVHQYVNYYTEDDDETGGFIYNIPKGDFLKQSQATTESYTIRAQLNYDKQINENHSLNLIFGGEIRDVLDKSSSAAYFGYDDQNLIHKSVDYTLLSSFTPTYAKAGTSLSYDNLFDQGYEDNRYVSIYSNVVYSYKGKYSATGSIRIDQSNLFGTNPKYRYKPLWSIGAAWNIHKENFMQDMDWVKSLKLRMAYGFNGNVAKNSLPQVIAKADLNDFDPTESSMLSLSSYANSGLRWEQTRNFNIGLDYTIFKNITGGIDYYIKKSTDILASNQIDASKGGTHAMVNQASIRNSGLEINLNADWITLKNFNWNTGFVLSHNSSKVLEVYNELDESDLAVSYVSGSSSNYLEGYAVGAMFNYRYAGLDSEGRILVYNKDGETENISYLTDKSCLDYSGSSIPTINIGLSNRVDIGNFYAYCMLSFYGGFKVRVPVPDASDTHPLEGAGNYWREEGDELDPDMLPAPDKSYSSYLVYTDKYTVNGDYLTIKDLTLAYSFRNSTWVKKTGISNFEVRAQVSNLFTVGLNKYNYSKATGSYAKSYLTPTYTLGLYIYF